MHLQTFFICVNKSWVIVFICIYSWNILSILQNNMSAPSFYANIICIMLYFNQSPIGGHTTFCFSFAILKEWWLTFLFSHVSNSFQNPCCALLRMTNYGVLFVFPCYWPVPLCSRTSNEWVGPTSSSICLVGIRLSYF